MDWIPGTLVLTCVQQTIVYGYPRPNLSLFQNSRSISCFLVFGAIFQELLDFEGDMWMADTVIPTWLIFQHRLLKYTCQNWNLWSDLIELGRPTSLKNLVKALTIAFALIFLKSTVSGNLVDTHMMVNKYWCPDLVWGIGPSRPLSLLIGFDWVFFLGFQGGISSLSAVQGNGFAIKPLFLSPTTFCFCVTLNFFPGS